MKTLQVVAALFGPSVPRWLAGRLLGLCLSVLVSASNSVAQAPGEWETQVLEFPHQLVDTSRLEIHDSMLFVSTHGGLAVFRLEGGQWTRCGTIGTPLEAGKEGVELRSAEGAIPFRPTALALAGRTLAAINLRPEIGARYKSRERLEILERVGDSCQFEWTGETPWRSSAGDGPPMLGPTLVDASMDEIVVGYSASRRAYVFQRSPMGGWLASDELQPQTRSGPLATSRDSRFGGGVAIWKDSTGVSKIAVSDINDDELIPPSGTVYVFGRKNGQSNFVLEDKLYAPDQRPGDRFGFDLGASRDWLRSANRLFAWSPNGHLEEQKGSPLQPAKLASGRHVVSVSATPELAVLGATGEFNWKKTSEELNSRPGRIYVFARTEQGWKEIFPSPQTPASASYEFGRSVAIMGRNILVSDPETKRVYSISVPETY